MRPYQGIYERMAFPPYRFSEFPKYVTRKNGERVIVKSRKEEIEIELEPEPTEGKAPDKVLAERDELAKRLAEAEAALVQERTKNALAVGAIEPQVGKVETETAKAAFGQKSA